MDPPSDVTRKSTQPSVGQVVSLSSKASSEDDVSQDGGTAGMNFVWKLMLCAQFLGMEASVTFEQLYTVPLMLTLGMPLRFSSVAGLFSGPVSLLMLPLIGWLIDRGSNTHLRKTFAIVFSAGVQITGMTCILAANAMHLMQTSDLTGNTSYTSQQTKGLPGNYTSWNLPSPPSDLSPSSTKDTTLNASLPDAEDGSLADAAGCVNDGSLEQTSGVPVKAGLCMLGFIMLEVSYDTMNSVVRSFVLACSPRAEHTSVLVLGLIMASAGGLSTAFLGIVDFTELFGLSSAFEEGGLVIQSSLQGILVSSFVFLGLLVSMVTGYKQRGHRRQYEPLPHNEVTNILETKPPELIALPSTGNEGHFDHVIGHRSQSGDVSTDDEQNSPCTEKTSLLSHKANTNKAPNNTLTANNNNNNNSRSTEEFTHAHAPQTHPNGPTDSAYTSPERLQLAVIQDLLKALREDKALSKFAETLRRCCKMGLKTKIALIFLATFFGGGMMFMFSMGGSDMVAKELYGGSPEALPGTDSSARYQEGMRTASRGFVVYYGTYLCFSFVQPRVLEKLGRRAYFVTTHLMMGVNMLVLGFTLRLEAFYFLSVVAGFHRASYFSVPFTIANDVIKKSTSSSAENNVGITMSIVTAGIPMGLCVIFGSLGPLEGLTGSNVISMWIGAAASLLASVCIVLIGED